jgi:hypothetical protein
VTNWAERQRATAEAFASPKPGDRFHEMYSWWMVVISAGADGVKVMDGSGPTNITRGRFPDGEIVEPFAERARVRWFATADDFRTAYRNTAGWTLTLSDRGKVDVAGWLERAKDLPSAPTDPRPPPKAAPPLRLLGKRVRVKLDEQVVTEGKLLGFDEGGEIQLLGDDGIVWHGWPALKITEAAESHSAPKGKTEPPGIWHGEPRLYSRWRYRDRTYRLVTVSTSRSYDGGGGAITLEYQDEQSLRERMDTVLSGNPEVREDEHHDR